MRYHRLVLSIIAVQTCIVYASEGKRPDKCVHIENINSPLNPNYTAIECVKNDICYSRTFNISYIELPSYYTINITKAYPPAIEDILLRCCGGCVDSRINHVNVFRNYSQLTRELLYQADFIFPFFGSPSTETLHGFHYLPIRDIPPAYLITERSGADFSAFGIKVLPLTTICILVSVLSGFFCWLFETWGNREEFSRTFLIGWFEGFWWSFVTMTTVSLVWVFRFSREGGHEFFFDNQELIFQP